MSAREELAQRLRHLMTQHEDTPTTLAQVFGIKSQSVDSWLRTGRIGKDRLPALAKRYSVSVAWLLGQPDDDEEMLADDERKLLADYRALRESMKALARQQVELLRKAQDPPPPSGDPSLPPAGTPPAR